ncbi:hypothetical protein ACFC3F_04250 [Microbacterium sp. NPDC055910]|uniref:hypothetical protein n=1 Tax=Microbacterium sp. NPDC055910 TaxID=3345659 RepID=UPI0035D7EA21
MTQLDIIIRELDALARRFVDAAQHARTLSGLTDWQSSAATAFHERAERWAGDVASLAALADTARAAAVHARALEWARLDRGPL